MLKAIWEKIKAGLIWLFARLWDLISDVEKSADPWKIAGLAAYVLSACGGLYIFGHTDLPSDKLGILAGLCGSAITVGTFLFGQSVKSDANLLNKGK